MSDITTSFLIITNTKKAGNKARLFLFLKIKISQNLVKRCFYE